MTETAGIRFDVQGRLGLVLLDRQDVLNALSRDMCVALHRRLDQWAMDAGIDAVIIEGAGTRAFCAGGDAVAASKSAQAGTEDWRLFFGDEYRLNAAIHHFPKPYIAVMDGFVMGGGVGVSVHGSHRIVTERTQFAMPETALGLFPDVGGGYFLPRLPGAVGTYLGLTGDRLKAADMVHLGIATGYVPSAQIQALKDALASAALSDGNAVDVLVGEFVADPGAAPIIEKLPEIDRIFALGTVEAIIAACDKSPTDWAQKLGTKLAAMSPTSLKVALRQMREGEALDFDDVMRMEYRIVHRVAAALDFHEGVRAVLVEKDRNPTWSPATLADVSDRAVDAHFDSLGERELVLP